SCWSLPSRNVRSRAPARSRVGVRTRLEQTALSVTPSRVRVSRETQQPPRFSISQVSTLAASFADDVRAYAEAGVDGIGIWELKLGDGPDDEALELVASSRLGCATAVPAIPSILPLPLLPGPGVPPARVEALCGSLHRPA